MKRREKLMLAKAKSYLPLYLPCPYYILSKLHLLKTQPVDKRNNIIVFQLEKHNRTTIEPTTFNSKPLSSNIVGL